MKGKNTESIYSPFKPRRLARWKRIPGTNVRTSLLVLILLVSRVSIASAVSPANRSTQSPAIAAEGSASAAQAGNDQVRHYPSRVTQESTSLNWKREKVDTTAGADYLTDVEKQVIIEINMLRTDPAEYARNFLVPLRTYYRGSLLEYPGEIPIQTREGIRPLDECINALHAAKPVSPLFPKKGLTLAARDHVRDQGLTGATGHIGSDNSTPETRINRYGRWNISAGENIGYGFEDPRRIVTSLLIDDGEPGRWHRIGLLNGSYKFVGVAVGPHKGYRHMCVMDFAGSYQ